MRMELIQAILGCLGVQSAHLYLRCSFTSFQPFMLFKLKGYEQHDDGLCNAVMSSQFSAPDAGLKPTFQGGQAELPKYLLARRDQAVWASKSNCAFAQGCPCLLWQQECLAIRC